MAVGATDANPWLYAIPRSRSPAASARWPSRRRIATVPYLLSEPHMYLGIAEKSGLVYEGIDGAELPALPTPILTQAILIHAPEDSGNLPSRPVHPPLSLGFP